MTGVWQDIATAPYEREVIVGTQDGVFFRATLHPNASMDENEKECDQWVATTIHPDCWTDGACWANNADEEPSDQPIRWTEIPAAS